MECCVVVVDHSEWSRNGDYIPSRLSALSDAANALCSRRVSAAAHQESTVAVISAAGQVQVRCTPTRDLQRVQASLSSLPSSGSLRLATAVRVAALALKNRPNRAGSQRVVAFVCSPVQEDAPTLEALGRAMRDSNIAVDIVLMGNNDANRDKLERLVAAASQGGNSHLVVVPSGTSPSAVLRSSPIMGGAGAAGAGGPAAAVAGPAAAMGGGADHDDIDVDPSMEPELFAALRASLADVREQQEQQVRQVAAQSAADAGVPALAGAGADDEDALLQQALAMSLSEPAALQAPGTSAAAAAAPAAISVAPPAAAAANSGETAAAVVAPDPAIVADDEDELARALAMSMDPDLAAGSVAVAPPAASESSGSAAGTAPAPAPAAAAAAAAGPTAADETATLARTLLGSVADIDLSDPRLQSALQALASATKQASEKAKEEEEDKRGGK